MKRYPVNWGPFLGQPAGTEVVCDGDVCRIVPVQRPPDVVLPGPAVVLPPTPGTPAPAPASSPSYSLPWAAVGIAAGVGVLLLALR